MGKRVFTLNDRRWAEYLYVEGGFTYHAIAALIKCSVPTLKKWSAAEKWSMQRAEKNKDKTTCKIRRFRVHPKLIEAVSNCKKDDDNLTRLVHTLMAWERHQFEFERIAEMRNTESSNAVSVDIPKLFLEFMEIEFDVLKTYDPQGLPVISRNFDRIKAAFKAWYKENYENAA